MFWGHGDSSKLAEDEQATLGHLRRLTETGHVVALEPDKTEVAIAAVAFYGQWNAVLKLLYSLKNVGILVGVLLGLYWATQGAIVDWVARIASGA